MPPTTPLKKIPSSPSTPTPPADGKQRADNLSNTARPLRTFQGDMAEMLQEKKSSVATVAIAEQKKRLAHNELSPSEKAENRSARIRVVVMIFSVLLILAGLSAITYLVISKLPNSPLSVPFPPTPLLPSERSIEIQNPTSRTEMLSALNNLHSQVALTPGQIENIFFSVAGATTSEKRLLTAQEFFARSETKAPAAFIRSLEPTFMFGFHMNTAQDSFLFLQTTSFQIAFAGMLDWEATLLSDLGPFIEQLQSTTSISPQNSSFKDELLDSKDVRVLRNDDGSIRLIYSFLDRSTLVITSSATTMKEVQNRYNAGKLAR